MLRAPTMKSCAAIFGPGVVVVGDPVDVVTGANIDRQLDFTLAGPLPLRWFRWYSSARNWDTGGHGWGYAHDFERRLVFDLDGARHHAPNGEVVRFPPLGSDGDSAAAGGYRLRRLDRRRYALARAGDPTAVFEAAAGGAAFALSVLRAGEAEIRFRYDPDGQLHTVTDSLGRAIRVEHDNAGMVSRLTMPTPDGRPRRLAAYDYDSAGNLVKVTDPYGNTLRFRYDAEHRQVRRTDRRGYSYLFEYDAAGRCVKAAGEDGFDGVRLDYDPALRTTLVTKADGGRWLYQYDADGMVIKVIAPDGGATATPVGPNGRPAVEVDAAGVASVSVYDAAGEPAGTIDPFGYYRPEGVEARDPNAYRVPTRPAEWMLGDLCRWGGIVVPEAGRAPAAAGSAARHLHARPAGAPLRPAGDEDEFGKLFRETFPDGTDRRWVYDPNGNVTKATDRDGGTSTYEYASANARVGETDPAGRRTRYEYAPSGAATAVTDPGGTRSEYRYDLHERLVEVRRHGRVRENYEHDEAGRLVRKTDGEGRELARWEVGPLGQPTACAFAGGESHTYAYDERGRFILATGGGAGVAFAYQREFRTADLRDGFGVAHRLGPDGVAGTTLFGVFTTLYRWLGPDECEIVDPTGRKHRLRDLGSGLVERALANGRRELDQYDAEGRCLARVADGTGGPRSRVFRYSGEGCLTAVEDSARGTFRYHYDASRRLVAVERPDGVREPIELDAAGNLLRMPGLSGIAVRDGNRLSEANGERFEYDARDHVSGRSGVGGDATRYHYDANDMLVRVERAGQPDWTASYDPFGRRLWKRWGTRRVEFWWDTDRLAAERDETGRLRVYVYADDSALVPLLFVDYAPGEADPAAGRTYTVHTDQIGTPDELRDEAGAVVWQADLAPYGAAAVGPAATVELNLRFPGHYFDAETGLHYNRFRYYDPRLGRYLQSDPIGIGGGLNLYAYTPRPLDRVDLRGLAPPPPPPPAYDASKPLTPAQQKAYDQTRDKTPSEARRDDCNKPGSVCAATGQPADPGKRLAADHIVPLKKITTMPGFTELSPAQQAAVANNPANFQPLKGGENSSKGGKEVKDWTQCRGKPVDPSKHDSMKNAAGAAEKELQAHIDKMLKDGKEAAPRRCSGCDVGTK